VGLLASVEDRAFLNRTMPASAIGAYQVPVNISNVLLAIPNAFAQVLFSRLPGSSESERNRLVLAQYARTLVLTSALVVIAAPTLPLLIPMLYGTEFAAAVLPSVVIALAGIPAAATTVLQGIARAETRVSICIQAEAGSMLVLGVFALLLIPVWGISGVAIACFAGRLFSCAWMLLHVPRALKMPGSWFLPWNESFRATLRGDLALIASAISRRRSSRDAANQAPDLDG
jgi:O-antigen/teichoic acid export membrane protein